MNLHEAEIENDVLLLGHLKSNKDDGFAILYEIYGTRIYTFAFRMLQNKTEAEDITQETFLQIFKSLDQFRGESRFNTWVFAIVKNLCIRELKKKKKNTFTSMETLIDSVKSHEKLNKFDEYEKQNLLNQIKDGCFTGLLRCLSFNQRMAFILNILLDLSIKDVAIILEKSEGAVKVLVHRARSNLKNFLCRNCSLYNDKNHCHCEDMLSFSLSQGWIEKPKGGSLPSSDLYFPDVIQNEINGIRKVVVLYKSLALQSPSSDFHQKIREEITRKDLIIFSAKKV